MIPSIKPWFCNRPKILITLNSCTWLQRDVSVLIETNFRSIIVPLTGILNACAVPYCAFYINKKKKLKDFKLDS